MNYTQHEKDMLKGHHGEASKLAMVILSELGGEIFCPDSVKPGVN